MKEYLKLMAWLIGVIVSISILAFVANALGFASFSFFVPKVEQVRYNTFKQSQAYNDGMLTDLQDMKREYIKATPDQQVALRELTLHRFASYDVTRLPPDLQSFYYTLQGQ